MESERQLMEPVITVVIPVYNCEKYVERAIRSVLDQPCADRAEVLVVDDGSRDRSGEICDRLAAAHETVRVLHKENGGVSSARNLGIEQAAGRYIAFLDSDDWWEPDFLDENLVHKFASGGADVYEFAYREVDRYKKLSKLHACDPELIIYEQSGFGRYDWTSPCRFCYSRKFLFDYGLRYPAAKCGEDGPFVEMALYHAKRFEKNDRIIFSYWQNMDSCVHTTSKIEGILESYKALLQEEEYFSQWGVSIDPEEGFVWMCAAHLPKICATSRFADVKSFMDSGCLKILEKRPDIKFGDVTWGKLEQWRANAHRYWIKQKIKLGIPLWCKDLANRVPVMRHIVNYLFNRYHRGFTPIQ